MSCIPVLLCLDYTPLAPSYSSDSCARDQSDGLDSSFGYVRFVPMRSVHMELREGRTHIIVKPRHNRLPTISG